MTFEELLQTGWTPPADDFHDDLLQQAANAATEGRIDEARELLRQYLEAKQPRLRA